MRETALVEGRPLAADGVPAQEGGGFVRTKGARAWIDRRRKLASIVPNEIVLWELQAFLSHRFGTSGGHLLDLGAGTKPYAPVYRRFFSRCTAVDVPYSLHDLSGIDVFAPADKLPFEDGAFDCVLCTEVLEHCPDPVAVMREIERVLRPGGYAFVTTPFLVPLHEVPHDYFRFTPSALEMLAEQAGMAVVELRPKGDYVAVWLATVQLPWTKLWQALEKRLSAPLYRPSNPLLFLPVVAPQLLYVAAWKRMRTGRLAALRRLERPFSHVTLGYVLTLRKVPSARKGSPTG